MGNLPFTFSCLLVFTNGLPINIAEIIIKNHIFTPETFILYKYYNKNFVQNQISSPLWWTYRTF